MARGTRARRGCLVVLLLAAVVGIGAIVALRYALDQDAFRPVAERELSQALGRRVRIGALDVDLLPAPLVTAHEISIGDGRLDGPGAPSVSLGAVEIRPDLRSVFGGTLQIDRVDLVGLDVAVRRTAEGGWEGPLPIPPAPGSPGGVLGGPGLPEVAGRPVHVADVRIRNGRIRIVGETAAGGGPREIATLRDVSARLVTDGAVRRLEDLRATFGGSAVRGSGRIGPDGLAVDLTWAHVDSADLPAIFALVGGRPPDGLVVEGDDPLAMTVRVGPDGRLSAAGKLAAETVGLAALRAGNVQAPFQLEQGVLTVSPMTFAAYGGRQEGTLRIDTRQDPAAWTLQSTATDLDVNAFLAASTGLEGKLYGRARLDARLRGRAGLPLDRSLAGTLELAITNGVVRNFPLLSRLNSALGITGTAGDDTTFESLQGTFEADAGRLRTGDLLLRAGALSIPLQGTIGFDGRLDLRGTATLSQAKTKELRRVSPHVAAQRNERGEAEVPFTIGGTAADPQIEIATGRMLQRAAEKELERQIRRGLDRLLKRP